MVTLLQLLVGCASVEAPSRFEDCPDDECRVAWAIEVFARDPDEAAEAVKGIEDRTARVAVVNRLAETYPGRTGLLCGRLERGPARERCERLNMRQHLQHERPAGEPQPVRVTTRAAGGPVSARLDSPTSLRSAFADVEPLFPAGEDFVAASSVCADLRDPDTCASALSEVAAAKGDGLGAARACALIEPGRWRWECAFHVADMRAHNGRAAGYADSVDLCLLAGDFVDNCLAHGLYLLADVAPDSSVSDPAAWGPAREAAAAVSATWEARHQLLAPLAVSRFWSEALGYAYSASSAVTGGPLGSPGGEAGIPEAAIPHLHAAAARRLLDLEDVGGRDLDGVAAALDAALALRPDQPLALSGASSLYQSSVDLWARDAPGDDAFPSIAYLGTSRRVWSPDVATDRRLALLEAAARTAPPKAELVAREVEATDPLVRFTAVRLIGALESADGRADPGRGAPGARPPDATAANPTQAR